jgi:hypothetical protein
MPPRSTSLIDASWYITIGLMMVLVIVLWAIYAPENAIPANWTKWEPFALVTVVMFAVVVRAFRRKHKSLGFWGLLAVLFGIHILTFVLLYSVFVQIGRQLVLLVIFPLEMMLMIFVLGRVFHANPQDPDL